MDYYIVTVTTPDKMVADNIARVMLEEKLAACVSIIEGVKTSYWWEDKIESATECQLNMKTTAPALEKIILRVKKLHPYKVPEVIATKIQAGNHDYLAWLEQNTQQG